uniref:GmrSD restriction endonucleases N-terminal domain-containing protein n=1 Tax=Psilocybe cubensis TaxID=181762 RepID=A0A8H7XPV9_PSICU
MSDDEYSDLTDFDSDENDDYKITHALSVPRPATYTTQALFDQIHNNDINLEPEYQRDVVWSEAKQIGLIDSIYRNFYVPPVIFTVQMNDEGAETRTCIDGKQRLTSIHKFMDGLIPHRDQFTGKRYWYKDTHTTSGARKKQLLHPRLRKLFANKQIVCMEYQNLSEEAEREIFQRVQLGMALTPAEKLQVVKTYRSDFVRELQNIYMKEEGTLSNGALQWDTSRGGDYRGLAQALYCMDKLESGFKNVGMPQLEKWLSNDQRLEHSFVHQVRDTFRVFSALAEDETHQKVFREPVKTSPVEFVMFAVFIYMHKDKATMTQLASGISKMRLNVRKEHVDIRTNSKVMKTMSDFIMKWKPTTIPGDTGSIVGKPYKSGGKRKRGKDKDGDDYMDSDEDDDEDIYHEEQARKAARKSTNAEASSSTSSSSAAPLSKQKATKSAGKIKIKIEPKSTSIISPPPPTDRLAALRRARETLTQQQAQHATASQQSPSTSSSQTAATQSTETSVPQMLPSPGQPFSFPSSTPTNPPPPPSSGRLPLPGANARLPAAPPATSASIDSTLMASMMQHRIGPPSSSSRAAASNLLPSTSSAATDKRNDHDRDKAPHERRDSGQFDSRRGR